MKSGICQHARIAMIAQHEEARQSELGMLMGPSYDGEQCEALEMIHNQTR
jgi:hypothetical protein